MQTENTDTKPHLQEHYHTVIIGGGPIGLACGIEAKKRGLTHLILEKGCIVNSIYHYPVNMTFFSTSDRLEIGGVPFISHGVKPSRAEALEYYRRVAQSLGLHIHTYELVTGVHRQAGAFTVITAKKSYTADTIIAATGFYDTPNLLGVSGEELPKVVHYYKEPHPYAARKIIVVGGGNSAVDVALETFRRGAEVTMVIKKGKLDDGVKYWVRPDIENRIKEGAIKAFFHSRIAAIRETDVDIAAPTGNITIENDFVLAMTGYRPDFSFLARMGISITGSDDARPVFDEKTFRTNVPGIFLAGVVCGGMDTGKLFIENTRYHASVITEQIRKGLLGE